MDNVFVPLVYSLTDDAPGYNRATQGTDLLKTHENESEVLGPICWKCSGTGMIAVKQATMMCKVCSGTKRLKVKLPFLSSSCNRPGEVTKRTFPHSLGPTEPDMPPGTLNNGEQLCGLIGKWRIFQRHGGHRWTTDDIVTAWVAVKIQTIPGLIAGVLNGHCAVNQPVDQGDIIDYLDLGCGNGSVLMMTSYHLPPSTTCRGLEARQEAVALARRSIAYNCGNDSTRIGVTNRDFRELYTNADAENDPIVSTKFQLVTGTPPYFRINFRINSSSGSLSEREEEAPLSSDVDAIIQQGGMPTCKESAPARCEFRGGIEAYCAAARAVLADNGVFVVCENWLNHDRVLVAVEQAGLHLCSVQRVCGKVGKTPLFCVYTCVLQSTYNRLFALSADDRGALLSSFIDAGDRLKPDLHVRDADGAWTLPYAGVLREMDYPVASLHPSGKY